MSESSLSCQFINFRRLHRVEHTYWQHFRTDSFHPVIKLNPVHFLTELRAMRDRTTFFETTLIFVFNVSTFFSLSSIAGSSVAIDAHVLTTL